MRDFNQIGEIMISFVVLQQHDKLQNKEMFWRGIEPLVAALRDDDYESIAKAALRCSTREGQEDDKSSLKLAAGKIATNPKKFGVRKLTKADLVEILAAVEPELAKLLPTSKGGMRDWYLSLGVDLEQSRGRPRPAIKRWLENHRKNPPECWHDW